MYSAFQSNAFQANAFQINGLGTPPTPPTIIGGHFLPAHHKNKRTLSNVNVIYKQAQALSRKETKELRDAISQFIAPEVAIIAQVPDISKVDYVAIEANSAAYEKFTQALLNIEERLIGNHKKQEEEDELLLMATFACLLC